MNVREWQQQGSFIPSYNEAELFLIFIDKYVKLAVGGHFIAKWMKMNRNKTLLDKLTSSDIAYTILVYENSKEVWEEEWHIKKSISDDIQRKQVTRHKKTQVS